MKYEAGRMKQLTGRITHVEQRTRAVHAG